MPYRINVKTVEGAPIPGATVSIVGADGYTLSAAPADTTGLYVYNDPLVVGDIIAALADGYTAASAPYANGLNDYTLVLRPKINYLPMMVVGGLAIGAAYLYLKSRKGIGATEHTDKTDYSKYILPAGLALVGYFVVRSVTNTLGLTETPEEKAQREATQNALISTTNQVLTTQSPTMSEAALAAMADRIYEDLRSPSPLFNTNNADDVVAALGTVRNTADVLKLIGYFGSRSQTLFGIPGPAMTLPQFVRTASHGPDSGQIDSLNAGYTAMGINWQW